MQEIRHDGTERLTMDPKLSDFMRAVADPGNRTVAIHNAPPVGAVIDGTTVTEDNRRFLVIRDGTRWKWDFVRKDGTLP